MNIQELETSKFSIFDTITDKRKRGAQVNAVKYIKKLAALSNTDISSWDIPKVFDTGGQLATDRNAINKLFFSYKDVEVKSTDELTTDMKLKLSKLQNNLPNINLAGMTRRRDVHLGNAKSYYDQYFTQIKQAADIEGQINMLKSYKPDYTSEIAVLVQDGFWKISDIGDVTITMETVNDIVLTHYNKRQAVALSVNVGRYKATFNFNDNRLSVQSVIPSRWGWSYPHPHVSGTNVCFGELQSMAHNMFAARNLKYIFELVQKVLTSYNDDSAYIMLHQLQLDVARDNKNNGVGNGTEELEAMEKADEHGYNYDEEGDSDEDYGDEQEQDS